MGYTHYYPINLRGCSREDLSKGLTQARPYMDRVLQAQKDIIQIYDNNMTHFNGLPGEECEDFKITAVEGFNFCKTNREPYDTTVVACLIILNHFAGKCYDISSDGTPAEWFEGWELARRVTELDLKYPEKVLNVRNYVEEYRIMYLGEFNDLLKLKGLTLDDVSPVETIKM